MNFREYLIEEDYNDFIKAVDQSILVLESGGSLNEGLLDKFTDKVKGGIEFIKQFTELVQGKLLDLLKVFKEKVIFTFFSKLKWSISELVSIVKKGYKLWDGLHNVIAEYIASNKVVKWTNDKLTELDNFLENHPLIKKAGALVVAGFLIYQWTQMISFTGDIEFDFDQSTLFSAIAGNYSLADLFATPDGIKMLMFIATGVLTGLSFPWPGNAWVLFTLSLVYTVAKPKYPQVASTIIKQVKKIKGIKE